jgi:tetratricopeptide (TPR) repeat protein
MARLDRLSAAKRVAQRAAVIGREFNYDLLEEVADLDPEMLRDGLARLVENELLFEVGEGADASYAFKHALIQDAAYQSLLRRTRATLHGRIADSLERRAAAEISITPELVARHFEAAGRAEAAVRNYRLAAEQAERSSGYREAIAHLRKGIELIGELPPDRARDEAEIEMQIELASSVMATRSYADPEAETAYERARVLCEALGDDVRVGYALTGLSIAHSNQGNVRRGEELAKQVLEIAEREDNDTLELLARIQLALPACYQGRFEEALEHADAAVAVYDRERHRSITFRFGTDHGVAGHAFAALSLGALGYPERALARATAARELAHGLAQPFNVAFAIAGAIITLWLRGDLEALETAADELVAISEEQGFDLFLGMGRMSGAAARALSTGDPVAIPEMIEGAAISAQTGTRGGLPALLCLIAEAHRAVGDRETAAGTVEGALAIAAETGQLAWDPRLLTLKGDLHSDEGDERQAVDCLRRALATAEGQGARLEALRATTRLARILHARGEGEQAAKLLAPACERFPERSPITDLETAKDLLGELRSTSVARP